MADDIVQLPRELFDIAASLIKEIAAGEHPMDSEWAEDWLEKLPDNLRDEACGMAGGPGDKHSGQCVCAREANHPLRDISVDGAPIASSHRCRCGDVWVDPADVILG